MKHIYLDHNATTPLHPEVARVIAETLPVYGNPSSLHGFGRAARALVEKAREMLATAMNADPEEIIFTGSGSEANNAVLATLSCSAASCGHGRRCRTEIVTSVIEHPCILETAKCMQERGTPVSFIPVDETGKVNMHVLEERITDETGIVSVMMANNEIGTIQDIKKIAGLVHAKGTFFHTDAVQAFGKVPIDVKELGVDFLTISGHKIYAPKGVGALYIKKGTPFCPLIRGGHQERGRRAGTENTIGIVALGKAVEMRQQEMQAEHARLTEHRRMLKEGILARIPDVRFNGHPTDTLTNTLNVSFVGAEGEAILLYLDLEGIAVSTGSACASGSLEPSHVLLATGIPVEHAHGSIRFSMGRDTTKEEISSVLEVLPRVIKKIRGMSTAYAKGAV